MYDIQTLSDIDIFFHYGENDLMMEIESDILSGLLQPDQSLFYDCRNGAGISGIRNNPNMMLLQVYLLYNISTYINYRNSIVGDGNNGTKDRRVAVSQNDIIIQQNDCQVNIDVPVIPLSNINTTLNVKPLIGGSNV